ncbi:hypothetical protein PFAG_01865 [Plasmodium falciparum Santa Lucia]|uniref:Uncharacterized protein n=1 Tax=Plasmodium falciparum Santa Lucia TaxID=478859 RepID=W7FSH2_PLAFA|nr:hypothetical protein PFAG_01865 [Plasmodium falciparum Santa Lucia]
MFLYIIENLVLRKYKNDKLLYNIVKSVQIIISDIQKYKMCNNYKITTWCNVHYLNNNTNYKSYNKIDLIDENANNIGDDMIKKYIQREGINNETNKIFFNS